MLRSLIIYTLISVFPGSAVISQEARAVWHEDIFVEEGACNTLGGLFRDDIDENEFRCYLSKQTDAGGRFDRRNITVRYRTILLDQPVYIIPDQRIGGLSFSLEIQEAGFLALESLLRGNGCSLHLTETFFANDKKYLGWPSIMLVEEGKVEFKVIAYNAHPGDASCVLGVKPHFTPIEDAAEKLYTGPFYKGPSGPKNAQKSMLLNIRLRNFLFERGYGELVKLSSLKVLSSARSNFQDSLHETKIVAAMCESYILGLAGREVRERGLEANRYRTTRFEDYLSHSHKSWAKHSPSANWLPDLRSLELRTALYRSLRSSGYFELSGDNGFELIGDNGFLPSNSELCFGGLIDLAPIEEENTVALSIEFFNSDEVQFAQDFSLAETKTQLLLDMRRFFRDHQNEAPSEILASVLTGRTRRCDGNHELFSLAPNGLPEPSLVIHGNLCRDSGGAARLLERKLVDQPFLLAQSTELDSNSGKPIGVTEALLTALSALGAEQLGEIIILDDVNPNYTEIRLLGDRGRVVRGSRAWENTWIMANLSNNRVVVRVETFLASKAGDIPPASPSVYKTSADEDYYADVQLFAEKLVIALIEALEI